MNDPDTKLLVFILLAAAVVGALWYFRDDIRPPGPERGAEQAAPVAADPPRASEPVHPLAPWEPAESTDDKLVPLPPLDDSDGYFLLALVDIFGRGIEDGLVSEALIDKFVATVDNLPRKHVAEKIRPVGRLPTSFRAREAGGGDRIVLDATNYERYDALVELIANADLDAVTDTYRRFYPLLQESYVRLGYPDGYFNDRVVEVIDHLLATPEPAQPIALVQPHVLYEYADAELEALSSGQKLLLRIGNKHSQSVKRVLRDLRARIIQPPGQARRTTP